MLKYSINDLEKITGIKAHTIRMWEKRYNVIDPERTPTNIRYYQDSHLKKLLNISTLNKHGIKISHILKMPQELICEKILEITNTTHDYETYINGLVIAMIEMNEDSFEKILSNTLLKIGFEKTVTNVLYPFLEKVGTLWIIGTINPAQEHFIVNLIRQKLIVAIDGQENVNHTNAKTFLLYLPENELHELGLLFYTYLIKKNGHKVIYLGQSVPFKDIIEVLQLRHADYLFTYFVSSMGIEDVPAYLQKLSEAVPDKKIFVTGYQVNQNNFKIPANVEKVKDAETFKDLMTHL